MEAHKPQSYMKDMITSTSKFIILLFVSHIPCSPALNLEPTSSSMPLALLRRSPLDLHTAQASGRDHGRINRALGDELLASGGQDGQDVSSSLASQLALIPKNEGVVFLPSH
jgi:hypothetical protein